MEFSSRIIDILLHADGKALATYGKNGLNVVPVSTIRVVDGNILLMNYFFKKTLENILEQPHVALACWRGLEGYQIKGTVEYIDHGDKFEEASAWVTAHVADRTLKGLLILHPEALHSVSPAPT